ncbi:hypothetical protein K504DRAFT_533000 [Pleomassaria siparia CBS 279.74]|uniref:Zn(2)-C6 fungal-type domain-containing protein n=1 Tax=Pleomassaria siparia CBS 279.74 TaxID=1314801 RepID=A0A6G1KAQ2_9PLEO|nr:hypothetical protein K504DRAFT_533000 [Pleomassaria siparia CBS 279.74]
MLFAANPCTFAIGPPTFTRLHRSSKSRQSTSKTIGQLRGGGQDNRKVQKEKDPCEQPRNLIGHRHEESLSNIRRDPFSDRSTISEDSEDESRIAPSSAGSHDGDTFSMISFPSESESPVVAAGASTSHRSRALEPSADPRSGIDPRSYRGAAEPTIPSHRDRQSSNHSKVSRSSPITRGSLSPGSRTPPISPSTAVGSGESRRISARSLSMSLMSPSTAVGLRESRRASARSLSMSPISPSSNVDNPFSDRHAISEDSDGVYGPDQQATRPGARSDGNSDTEVDLHRTEPPTESTQSWKSTRLPRLLERIETRSSPVSVAHRVNAESQNERRQSITLRNETERQHTISLQSTSGSSIESETMARPETLKPRYAKMLREMGRLYMGHQKHILDSTAELDKALIQDTPRIFNDDNLARELIKNRQNKQAELDRHKTIMARGVRDDTPESNKEHEAATETLAESIARRYELRRQGGMVKDSENPDTPIVPQVLSRPESPIGLETSSSSDIRRPSSSSDTRRPSSSPDIRRPPSTPRPQLGRRQPPPPPPPSLPPPRARRSLESTSNTRIERETALPQPPGAFPSSDIEDEAICDACREKRVKCDGTETTACSECSSQNEECRFTKTTDQCRTY